MILRILLGWFAVSLLFGAFYAAGRARWLWFHTHWPIHRQRMRRAQLCLEAADHFGAPTNKTWIAQAYRLCWDCGCPADLWPVGVVRVHAGTYA